MKVNEASRKYRKYLMNLTVLSDYPVTPQVWTSFYKSSIKPTATYNTNMQYVTTTDVSTGTTTATWNSWVYTELK